MEQHTTTESGARAGSGLARASRPKLLFLCQTLPYPPDGGVEIRSGNVMRLLSRSFDVTALCFYRAATRSTREQVERGLAGLREFAEAEAFPIPQEQSRLRLLYDHLRSLLFGEVYTRYAYSSAAYAARLEQLLAERRFDIVHMDSLDLSAYLPQLGDIPVVCTHHNVESDLLRRRAQAEKFPLLRRYIERQADLTEAEERKWCGSLALNVAVSPDDARRLREIAPGAPMLVVPNGVDTNAFRPANEPVRGVVFVGGYGWHPNRDAMEYFVAEILPLIRAGEPELAVTWVGRAPDAVKAQYQDRHGVRLTGYVEDIRPHVQPAACFIVPLRVGGGTRLKVLDAWAMGKAVVSTTVGCEGLDARDGENILIRDTPDGFADAVRAIVGDERLRQKLGESARRTAERDYDWEVLGRRFVSEYLSLLPQKSLSAPAASSALHER